MHAIRQYTFGPAENLLYEEVADPVPADGQVRIAVEASGVHLIDTSIKAYRRPRLPTAASRAGMSYVVTRASGGWSFCPVLSVIPFEHA